MKRWTISLFIFSITLPCWAQPQSKVIHPKWSENATIYEANIRQFSKEGTFKAFEKHVPELKKMGVKIIWIMPINPIGEKNRKGTLGSYYSVKDYKGINPEFGNEKDLHKLIKTIHNEGMFVILDWVANHTAWDHPWTKTHPEYYTRNATGDFVPPVEDWGDVIDLNYDNAGLRLAMLDAMAYWVKNFDVDGFRCDVADMVPTDFWDFVRPELEKIKPIFMLAESAAPFLQKKAFDMTYGWQFKDLFNEIAQGKKSAKELDKYLTTDEWVNYPHNAYRMIFTTNHDENSWNGTEFERLGSAANLFTVLSVILPGMPLMYTGQEFGSNKRLDFFEKDLIVPDEKLNQKKLYKTLFNLKLETPALWNGNSGGNFVRLKTNNDTEIFAFVRKKDKSKVIGIFNLTNKNQSLSISDEQLKGNYKELGAKVSTQVLDKFKTDLKPWQYIVWVSQENK